MVKKITEIIIFWTDSSSVKAQSLNHLNLQMSVKRQTRIFFKKNGNWMVKRKVLMT